MRYTYTVMFFLIYQLMIAQDQLAIGEWKTHLPFRECMAITQTPKNIVVSTGRALLFLDKQDLSQQRFDKKDGLSETLIDNIYYDKYNDQLIITYQNSNIDFLKDGQIFNVPDLKENQVIIGSREILGIVLSDSKTCFLATSIGIIKYDLENREFRSTTFTDVPINAVSTDDTYVYAATQEGLYRIEKDNPNLANFSLWKFLSGDVGLPASYESKLVATYNSHIYATIDGELYVNQGNVFTLIDVQKPSTKFKIEYLSANDNHLIIGLKDNSVNSEIRLIDSNGSMLSGGANCTNRSIFCIEDEQNRIWYADKWRQIRYTEGYNFGCHTIEFDSPFSYECSQIEVMKDKVFFASGGAKENFTPVPNRSGTYVLEVDKTWNNINGERYPILEQSNYISHITVAPVPNDDKVFIGSYLSGVILFDLKTEEIKQWGKSNSTLQTTIGDDFTTRVSYMKLDDELNLWVTNFGAPKPISVFTKDSIWLSLSVPSVKTLSKFTIDQSNRKWFVATLNGSGVLILDHGSKIEDPSDDKYKFLNSTNSLIEGNVNCVEVDLDGDVWVGTSSGPIVFDCDVFNENCQGNRRKVLQDSIVAYLLETEDITAIEIDGANRKWFGTRNGIFVQSADGETEILKLNVDNSPLFSNLISDLDFDSNTGIMYIATSQGIQSYKTDATLGTRTHDPNKVYAYPNPVRPEYNGPIAIKGLVRDSNIKITDINGKLVFETKANGGQAIWDGLDYNGRKADSGVYLVFSTGGSQGVSDAIVTKILIVK